jgi:hypothetical protein
LPLSFSQQCSRTEHYLLQGIILVNIMYLCLIYMKTLYFHPNLIIASSQNASILSIAGGSFARILASSSHLISTEREVTRAVSISLQCLPSHVFRAVHAQERAKVRKQQILTTALY